MNLNTRVDLPELMDTERLSAPVMNRTLSFLVRANRTFGGTRVILKYLDSWSARWDRHRPVKILDVGTGAADIPRALARWARQKGFHVDLTGIDLVSEIVALAQKNTLDYPEISIRQADLFDLARTGERFDYVLASLFLHHVRPEQSQQVLQLFDRLSTRGIIVSDLHRSQASYWTIKLFSQLSGNYVVRHDAPLSVRRAFRIKELERLAADAGLRYLRANTEPWFRVSLAGEKSSG